MVVLGFHRPRLLIAAVDRQRLIDNRFDDQPKPCGVQNIVGFFALVARCDRQSVHRFTASPLRRSANGPRSMRRLMPGRCPGGSARGQKIIGDSSKVAEHFRFAKFRARGGEFFRSEVGERFLRLRILLTLFPNYPQDRHSLTR